MNYKTFDIIILGEILDRNVMEISKVFLNQTENKS